LSDTPLLDSLTEADFHTLIAATQGANIIEIIWTAVHGEPAPTDIKGALLGIAPWIIDNIVRPAIEGAIWLIDWIKDEIRYWTYEAVKWLTEFTESTSGMIITLAAVIGIAILAPQAIAAFAQSSVGIAIKKIVDWVKEKIGNILESVHFVDLLAIHEALLVLWPTWKEIFNPFQNALSALAEQLGQGSGYIHAWLSVGHGLSLVGTSLLNIDPQIGEIRAMEKSKDFMEKIDAKMRAYQHDPGLIARDIVETFYIPYAEEIRDTQGAVIKSIKDGRDYTLDLNHSLTVLDNAFQELIDATLPEFRDQMERNLSGMRTMFSNFSEFIEGEVLPKLGLAIDILSERADYLERANAKAIERLDHPLDIFTGVEFLTAGEQVNTWAYLNQRLGEQGDNQISSLTPALDEATEAMIQATEADYYETPPAPPPVRKALSLELPEIPPVGNIPSWYRGED